jgi:beta-galactosidase/beta-glucuronidase
MSVLRTSDSSDGGKSDSGTLIWQFNDYWPVASWSSFDCFGCWKTLHNAAKRFYAPLLLSVEDMGDRHLPTARELDG